MFSFLLDKIPEARILDVGSEIGESCYSFIEASSVRGNITSVNILPEHIEKIKHAYPEIDARVGDARDLPFPDKHFDVVFSNAVIEHVGGLEDQFKMASEVMRVGKNWFITTPNRLFPFEFHMRLPLVTWLPHKAMHWFGEHCGYNHVHRKYMAGNKYFVRLVTPGDFQRMFPDSRIIQQRITIMPENLIAVGGEAFKMQLL
jgi:SAM-dependent methyltransferase